jgi:hypothetical protein
MHEVTKRWGGTDEANEEVIFMADEIKRLGKATFASLRKVSKAYNRSTGIYTEELRKIHFTDELRILYELRLVEWCGREGKTLVTWTGPEGE